MRIAVEAVTESERERAERLADELSLPLEAPGRAAFPGDARADLTVAVTGDGLSLHVRDARIAPLRVDVDALAGGRPGRDDLLRAVIPSRSEMLRVVDATAGMGADGFRIAAEGAEVTMIERSPVLWALLRDALERAGTRSATAEAAARVRLVHADARMLLPELAPVPVVYLDPMYPDLGKSARKNKAMHLFRALVGDDSDAGRLLDVARASAMRRVVVKRPAKAAPLAPHPSGSIGGRTVRFDLYPPAR